MGKDNCQGCRDRDAVIADLQQQLAALQAEVRELQARVNQNASNSSLPPSANPPQAPKPVTKKPSPRRPGAQPGHAPQTRRRYPPDRIQQIITFVPDICRGCQAPLSTEQGPHDPEPTWHQVAELPELTAQITEYQGHGRRCRCCADITWALIPADIRAHSIGPRLTAVLSYLSAGHPVSRRGVEEIAEHVFAAEVALGTVANLEQEVSHSLASAHAEAACAVRQAEVKHADETSWKRAGQKCWLWLGATAMVAFFVIHARRSAAGLRALLGETIHGIVCSDRWGVYQRIAVACRQLCWAHLKRDFQKCVDRGGAALAIGNEGLAVVQALFERWHRFRGGGLDRHSLQVQMAPVQHELRALLERGCVCADSKVATFCGNVLAVEGALWTFVRVDGVEATNNHAERLQRKAVLWRKNAFGSGREAGCRFVERMLTVVQTLRLQQRPILTYLQRAVEAHRAGLPAPKLLLSV
jgi:transposase